MLLDVRNLRFSYGPHRVLSDVSFDVAPGEIVGLVGPNGAGKTTLLKILATLLLPDSGSITLSDTNPFELPIKYRRSLGYLPESCPLYPEMSVTDYLVYRAKLKGERAPRIRRRVTDALATCGLAEVASQEIASLSKGYQKRVGLADAMLRRPKLILLDDPLAGLDAASRTRTGEILSAASVRSAIILAGHEIHEMIGWCTRFLVLRQGRLVYATRMTEPEREAQYQVIMRELDGQGEQS